MNVAGIAPNGGGVAVGLGLVLDGLVSLGRLAVAVTVVSLAFGVDASKTFSTSALQFRAVLVTESPEGSCPPQAPPGSACRTRSGTGLVRGLGSVSSSYTWFYAQADCPSPLVKPFATTGRIVVAQKGEIDFALAEGTCVEEEPVRNQPQHFTITGGTGIYQGASGDGTVARFLSGGAGTETWTGTLTVPGLDFDLTPPTIKGAHNRVMQAPTTATRIRVKYKVTAQDAIDGALRPTCRPRSGSRFRVGRQTTVRCSVSDHSANFSRAKFKVVVRPR